MTKKNGNKMNAREFFYLVADMRRTQREYFNTHAHRTLIACKCLEKRVDDEIERVKAMLGE